MSPFTKKQTIAHRSLEETSVQPIEKESLKSAKFDKGIAFFSGRCVVRAANRFELRQQAYEYVNKIYRSKGYTKNKSSNLWLTIYDALPDTTTLVAEDENGAISGALTIVTDSPIGLPSDELYKSQIDSLRRAGRKINELISLGINSSKKDSIKVMACLFYCAWLLSWRAQKHNDFVIAVNPLHEKFYRSKTLFRRIGPLKKCNRVNGAPAVFLNLPLSLPGKLREKQRIFPLTLFQYSDQKEEKIASKLKQMVSPMSDVEFYTFFIEKTDVWENATPEQKKYLKEISDVHAVDHFSISRVMAKAVSKKYQNQNDSRNKNKLKVRQA